MNIDVYLERIRYTGSLVPTLNVLAQLQQAHMLTVPFENLNISIGQPIVLAEDALFDKIVRRRRGGFCYELNSLFAKLLQTLGYQVTFLSAEVARADGTFGPPFDHLTLRVDLDQSWLVDVGFGDSFRLPLPLESSEIQRQHIGTYRLLRREEYHVLEESQDNRWVPQYRFRLEPHVIDDFQPMCQYHQTSPESSFTRKRVCSIATPIGRITLSEMNLIITDGNERKERVLTNEQEYHDALLTYFDVRLPETN